MDFSAALKQLRQGERIHRAGWNATGQRVSLQKGYPDGIGINANTAESTGLPEGEIHVFRPYLMLQAKDGSFVPWQPTTSDVLADDWLIDLR